MSAMREQTRFTEKEYLALERESDIRHEFIDGQIYAMVGATEDHITISINIVSLLHPQLRKGPCKIYNSEMRVRISENRNYTYPDITVVCGQRELAEDTKSATLLNPTVIIEVLSPSTEGYDRGTKFHQYQRLPSLQDYVLVSQDKPLIECFSRGDNDTWTLTQAKGLDSAMTLPSISASLALTDVYERVTFEDVAATDESA